MLPLEHSRQLAREHNVQDCLVPLTSPPCSEELNSHFSLDNVGVYLGDSVNGVGPHDAQMGHVHPLASLLLDQRHLPQLVHVVRVESCNFLREAQSGHTGQVGGLRGWWLRLRVPKLALH